MMPSKFKLVPKEGWTAFERSHEVMGLIWASLSTKRQENPWRYYNMTSCTSIWDSDASGDTSLLCVSYLSPDSERMEELDITQGVKDSPFNRDLAALKQRLIHDYAFEEFTS